MLSILTSNNIKDFSTILLSIILEGFPFIIIGALMSSLIQVFVSEDTVKRLIPRNKLMGMLSMAFIGLIFPICECAIIPIARRLIKKGVPASLAITFMLSVPIVNPVVLMSTYYAFLGQPTIVFFRALAGIGSAVIIGYLIGELHTGEVLKNDNQIDIPKCGCDYCNYNKDKSGFFTKIIRHSSYELYDIGRFFIIGAVLSSLMQTFVPKSYIAAIGKGPISSVLTMMLLAFLLSICSETDAFIARTFLGQFTKGSILGFLIFGPMLDVKNTIMLTGSFSIKFVIKLIFIIFSICFIVAILSNFIPYFSLR